MATRHFVVECGLQSAVCSLQSVCRYQRPSRGPMQRAYSVWSDVYSCSRSIQEVQRLARFLSDHIDIPRVPVGCKRGRPVPPSP